MERKLSGEVELLLLPPLAGAMRWQAGLASYDLWVAGVEERKHFAD